MYLRSKRIASQEALIQAETQIVFQLVDKSKGYLREREGDRLHQWKEGISTGADQLISDANSKQCFLLSV